MVLSKVAEKFDRRRQRRAYKSLEQETKNVDGDELRLVSIAIKENPIRGMKHCHHSLAKSEECAF
jgi:hypothetical protein